MKTLKALLMAGLVLSALCAYADTVTGTAGAGWQSWTTADLDKDGKPYWDNTSQDGLNKNIGYCLTGTGGCAGAIASPPGAIPFWGMPYAAATDTGGAADLNFYFNHIGTTNAAALILEIAGDKFFNSFGWFETDGASVIATHQLFSGADSPTTTATFTPTALYGLYMEDKNGDWWFTLASKDRKADYTTVDPKFQHFALFQGTGGFGPLQRDFWVGVEDRRLGYPSDKDYNDMVIHISPLNKVPEPGSMVLLGTGLLALARGIRRRVL